MGKKNNKRREENILLCMVLKNHSRGKRDKLRRIKTRYRDKKQSTIVFSKLTTSTSVRTPSTRFSYPVFNTVNIFITNVKLIVTFGIFLSECQKNGSSPIKYHFNIKEWRIFGLLSCFLLEFLQIEDFKELFERTTFSVKG